MGPTADDITVGTVAAKLGKRLVEDPGTARRVRAWYLRRGAEPTPESLRQALVPEGATVHDNPVGSAPGLVMKEAGKTIVILPGVPTEMKALAEGFVLPGLAGMGGAVASRVFRMAGIPEAAADARVRDVWNRLGPGERLALQIESGEVHLRLTVSGTDQAAVERRTAELSAELSARLGGDLYAVGDAALEEVVVARMRALGLRLAVAESVTGGLLAARLVAAPGASAVLAAGWVVYRDEAKRDILGVSPELLAKEGAVSAAAAGAMASGAMVKAGVDIGLATTGYAGPDGGTASDPVGTVYIALSSPEVKCERRWFRGPREAVRAYAVTAALDLVRRHLK